MPSPATRSWYSDIGAIARASAPAPTRTAPRLAAEMSASALGRASKHLELVEAAPGSLASGAVSTASSSRTRGARRASSCPTWHAVLVAFSHETTSTRIASAVALFGHWSATSWSAASASSASFSLPCVENRSFTSLAFQKKWT
jgi:hypothetical protein